MSLTILPRRTWTTTAPGFTRYPQNRFTVAGMTGLVLHYPANGAAIGVVSQAVECGYWRAYRNYHVQHRGWADIGYNFGVAQSGRTYELAGGTHASAHAASSTYPAANLHNMGVVLLLGDNEAPTPAMIASVNALWAELHDDYPNMDTVRGHGQVRGALTSCPGRPVLDLIRAGRFRRAAAPTPAPAPAPPPPGVDDVGRYNVRSGDTLGELAARFRTSVDALVLLNGISDPDRIDVGQRLYTRWVVGRGDTLSTIAAATGTSVSTLVRLNGIKNPDVINVGQLVRLP